MIPKQFIRGHDVNINIHKRFPWAAGYKLQATGGRLQARGNRLQARSNRAARSFRLQARGYEHHVWGLLAGSFRYVGGLSESGDFQLQMLHRCCAPKLFFKICGIGKSQ